MSVAPTAGLMLFERKVSTLIRFVPIIFREGLSTSLAAQVGVAPSCLSLLANSISFFL